MYLLIILSLNENDIGDFRTFLKLSPPLRKEEDRLALGSGLKRRNYRCYCFRP